MTEIQAINNAANIIKFAKSNGETITRQYVRDCAPYGTLDYEVDQVWKEIKKHFKAEMKGE
jgi:hypothetical protein